MIKTGETEASPLTLPPEIPRRLREFERARQRLRALQVLVDTLFALGLGLVAVALIEGLAHPALPGRMVLSYTLEGVAGIWLVGRLGMVALRRRALRDLARDFEKAAGLLEKESIWSAVEMAEAQVAGAGTSRWMVEQTLARAARQIAALDPRALLDRAPLTRSGRRAAGVAGLLLLGLLVGARERLWLALNPRAAAFVLARVQFTVTPGNCTVTEGTNFVVTVATDRFPENGKLAVTWADGGHETIPLNQTGTNLFQSEIPGVAQSLRYQVLAEGAESPVFTAQIVRAPKLARLAVLVQPPAYTGWTNQTVEGGSADFLAGSRVTVELSATGEKVARAEFRTEGGTNQIFQPAEGQFRLALEPTEPIRYGLRLAGENQLVTESATDNLLTPTPDLPPTALLTAVGSGYGLVERDEILPLTVQAADDVGLQSVDLVILTADLRRTVRNLYHAPTNGVGVTQAGLRDFSGGPNFNLLDLQPNAGEEVQFVLLATDVKGQTNQSSPVSFIVGSAEKLREARLAARLKLLLGGMQAGAENLRLTRTAWLAGGRNFREQDATTRAESLKLVQSRVTELGREIDRIGRELVTESQTNEVHDTRLLYRLGSSLSVWAQEQGRVLHAEMGRLGPASGDEAPVIFNRGGDLLNLASGDLANFTHTVAVLQGALESDVLASRCEMSQGRYKRVFPVVRGEAKSLADALVTTGGLQATFYEGTELRGKVLEEQVALPRVANNAPAGRRENWSARYEGQFYVTESGDWTLACVVDDGVRLFVDGKSLLPGNAWGPHSATEFRADVKLTAGWHPVKIEFYQGASESKLQFLQAKKGAPLVEVPAHRLRPREATASPELVASTNSVTPETLELLRARLATSLAATATVPPKLSEITNAVEMPKLTALVADGGGTAVQLTNHLARAATWEPEESNLMEGQADDLTVLAEEARRLLREELDWHRWQYEGAEALKEVQTAINELRSINERLRRLPWNDHKKLDETEQAQVDLAKVWEKELARATAEAAHQLFEQARQKDATLAERMWALNASVKAERELAPAVAKLAPKLEENRNKNDMGDEIDRRLNEINDRYRELNDQQERINREHVAGLARAALPTVRAFARAPQGADDPATAEKFNQAHEAAERIAAAERVVGDYQTAAKLEALAGNSPQTADARALANEVRGIASQTDRNPPSLAQAIPPPMQKTTADLAAQRATPAAAADQLAVPRLAMSLEAARLNRQGDGKAAVAYELLGQDLGQAINTPDALNEQTLQPLTDRALALAGAKGDEARKAELLAAAERAAKLPANAPGPLALANELESLSGLAKQGESDASKDAPLMERLDKLSGLAAPVPNWSESSDPVEVAASAAHESEAGLAAAPRNWEAHNQASEMLGDAARQLRMAAALKDLAGHEPFPAPPGDKPSDQASDDPGAKDDKTTQLEGATGKALTQPAPRGVDQAEWARLNDRLRKNIRNAGAENFTAEQRAAIQAYFEKLGSAK